MTLATPEYLREVATNCSHGAARNALRDAADEIEQVRRDLEIWRRNGGDDLQRAEIERLSAALMRLANEVRATTSLAEAAIREAAGNTNYQCLMDAESGARVALKGPPLPSPSDSKDSR